MRTAMLACLVGAVVFIASDRWLRAGDNPDYIQKALERAAISLGDAVNRALTEIPDSKAVEASLETKNGNLTYEIEVVVGGKHRIVEVNPGNGSVEKTGGERIEENQEDARERVETDISKAPVTLEQAVRTAMEKHPDGRACRVEPKRRDGKLVFSVELLAEHKLVTVDVDAKTRQIVSHGG